MRLGLQAFAATLVAIVSLVPGTSSAVFGGGTGSYPYVGRTLYNKSGVWTQSATGVAIAPDWVITAGHAGGQAFEQDGERFEAAQRFWSPDADLMLMKLKSPVRFFVPVCADPFEKLKGQTITIVGAGLTAAKDPQGWKSESGTAGRIHAASNTIDDQGDVPIQITIGGKPADRKSTCLIYDIDNPAGGQGSLGGGAVPNEGGQAGLDSGGAWLVKRDGKAQVAAICAYITPGPQSLDATNPLSYGGLGYGVHLGHYADWIKKTIHDNQ